jgi:parvulin-like peptidyl-prolyl isomerase
MTRKRVGVRRTSSRGTVQDRRGRRLPRGIWAATALTLAVVAVLTLLIYHYNANKLGAAIANVNGVKIPLTAYQKEIRYAESLQQRSVEELRRQRAALDPGDENYSAMLAYYDQAIGQAQQQAEPDLIPLQALQVLVSDEVIRQGAEQMGLTVSEPEIQNEIYRVFGTDYGNLSSALDSGTNASLSQQQREKDYRSAVSRAKEEFGMSEGEFRSLLTRQALRVKLASVLAQQLPSAVAQVHIRHILVADEAEAKAVVDRLAAGEDFAAVAAEVSLDQRTKDQGGDLGWFPRGTHSPAFEDRVFALQSQGDIDIVEDGAGFHVVMLVERDDRRPLPPATLEYQQRNAIVDWLQKQRTQSDISYNAELYQELSGE